MRKREIELSITSLRNAKAKLEDNSAEVAAEAGLVGTIDRDDGRLAGSLALLDHNDVVARNAHRPIRVITDIPP